MEENKNKKRRLIHPTLDTVKPLQVPPEDAPAAVAQVLPTFLHNTLFSQATDVPHEDCPFDWYIDLGEPAWAASEDESRYLIERRCYKTLIEFVDERFATFQVGVKHRTVVTGTAGIGKTFFALYAARYYFQKGELVVLYYNDHVWAFCKTDPKELVKAKGDWRELDPNLRLQKGTQPDGKDFWYKVLKETKPAFEQCFDQWMESGCAIIIRDPGESKTLSPLNSSGRELYAVSAGQQAFLAILAGKTRGAEDKNKRTGTLWSSGEFMYSVKLGLIWPEPKELDLAYVMEGYRRYGGSARRVFNFADMLRDDNVKAADIQEAELEVSTLEAIRKITEQQFKGEEELTKAKSLFFHQSPEGKRHRLHFSSSYLAQKLIQSVKLRGSEALQTVVAALSVGAGHQDAYRSLYETEVHRALYEKESVTIKLGFLGCHPPSLKRKAGEILPNANVEIDLARTSIVCFPGHSLEVIRLQEEEPIETYFHPLTSNFPTHDSFILCPASTFFTAGPTDITNQKNPITEESIKTSIVLVGLQMTVSGSDKAGDKPSHIVAGAQLTKSLQAIKKSIRATHPNITILDDIVTIFVSPVESCRKMNYMPVLDSEGKELQRSIQNMQGIAPQYCAPFEVEMIKKLMS